MKYVKWRGVWQPWWTLLCRGWRAFYWRLPWNKRRIVAQLYWTGNMVCSNRSLQGVIIEDSDED